MLAFACSDEPEEPNAFNTQGNTTATTDGSGSDTAPLPDMPADTGDTETTTSGDGDGDQGDGDGDGDPTTGGDAVCGDGIVDEQAGEHCDGGNLNGNTCNDLGYDGGTLACNPVMCTFDTSACTQGGDGGGGTTG